MNRKYGKGKSIKLQFLIITEDNNDFGLETWENSKVQLFFVYQDMK